jgi:D-alanyl-D-alanine dipeptidase
MGSSFDLFDEASHTENNLIEDVFKERRAYFKNIMEKCGFVNYSCEWWHFTFNNEPYPATRNESYFNFAVE